MAYDPNKLTKLQLLKDLGTRMKSEHDALAQKVDALELAGGEPNVLVGVKVNGAALAIAEKMVDILVSTGTTDGSLSVNGADIMVAGLKALAFKAEVSEAELSAALKAAIGAKAEASEVGALAQTVTTLIGGDTGKSARAIANEELAAQLIPENAQESLDTLTELAAWIRSHPDDAAAMNAAIAALQALVGTLPEGAASTTVAAYIDEAVSALRAETSTALDGKVNASDIATDEEGAEMLAEIFGDVAG